MNLSIEELASKVTFPLDKYLAYLESLGPTSEQRFKSLQNPEKAVRTIEEATREFSKRLILSSNPSLDVLPRRGRFGLDSYIEAYCDGSSRGEFLTAWNDDVLIGFALVVDGSINAMEVSRKYRRGGDAGMQHKVDIEGGTYSVGVGHALVATCMDQFDELTADTNSNSSYLCKSLGFEEVGDRFYRWKK